MADPNSTPSPTECLAILTDWWREGRGAYRRLELDGETVRISWSDGARLRSHVETHEFIGSLSWDLAAWDAVQLLRERKLIDV